jgi:hypothetical protein
MQNSYKIFIWKHKRHRPPGRPSVCSRIIFKLSYRNRVGCAICIHLVEGGVHFHQQGNVHLGIHRKQRIVSAAERLLSAQEGICYTDLTLNMPTIYFIRPLSRPSYFPVAGRQTKPYDWTVRKTLNPYASCNWFFSPPFFLEEVIKGKPF